jgi:ABC-type Zn2+ transport system substrate-binding protein/surface adhesin
MYFCDKIKKFFMGDTHTHLHEKHIHHHVHIEFPPAITKALAKLINRYADDVSDASIERMEKNLEKLKAISKTV